jgi:transposase
MTNERKAYPRDVTDEEWTYCVSYLTLMKEDAPQREHPLRELFNGLRWLVRAGCFETMGAICACCCAWQWNATTCPAR